jgi:hypothetical protein
MSLWTPGGDHPVPPSGGDAAAQAPDDGVRWDDLTPDQQAEVQAMQAEMEQVRRELLGAPAAVVVANHAMGLYELAALHLTAEAPKLDEASVAIDALGALVEGLEGRLGENESTLREALGGLRAAYLEVRARSGGDGGSNPA